MKANEFFKSMGLSAVKTFLDNGNIRSAEMAVELKRLVESHELIKKFHGVEKAKYELKLIEDGSIFRCCVAITAEMLKQAISDVEACQ